MRVMHVDSGRELRGGQVQLALLAGAAPPGWAFAVALPPDAPLRPALEAAGVAVFPVASRGPLLGRRALAAAARAFGAELLAAHTSHAHAQALGQGLPVVVHRRVDFRPRAWSRWKYAAADGYVAVSGAVRDVLLGVGVERSRIAVVHDAVDPGPLDATAADRDGVRAELGLSRDARLVLAVGALVPHKGHRILVDAAAALPPDVTILVAGDGPLRAELAHRSAGRVRFLGARGDVPRLLKAVDVLAHPSLEEGLGQVVAEALIAGCPVVASTAGGLPEILGEAGLLVPPGDPAALARGLMLALADPVTARARVSAAGPEARRRHAPDRLVEATLAAYVRFAGAAPRSRLPWRVAAP